MAAVSAACLLCFLGYECYLVRAYEGVREIAGEEGWALALAFVAPLALGIAAFVLLSEEGSPNGPLTVAWIFQCAYASARRHRTALCSRLVVALYAASSSRAHTHHALPPQRRPRLSQWWSHAAQIPGV